MPRRARRIPRPARLLLATAGRAREALALAVALSALAALMTLVVTSVKHQAACARAPAWAGRVGEARPRIALVTLADGGGPAAAAHSSGARSFGGVLALQTASFAAYARMHAYANLDASDVLSPEWRENESLEGADSYLGASWYKIAAVRRALFGNGGHEYDWVLWHDADTLLANARLPLETLLPTGEGPGDGGPHFIVSEDAGGFNAGVWLARRSEWTDGFLEEWWGMRDEYARGRGDTKSGDNDALKALLARTLGGADAARVGVLPQCAFNSYYTSRALLPRTYGEAKMRARAVLRWLRTGQRTFYAPGDLLVHFAGVDDKAAAMRDMAASLARV